MFANYIHIYGDCTDEVPFRTISQKIEPASRFHILNVSSFERWQNIEFHIAQGAHNIYKYIDLQQGDFARSLDIDGGKPL